MGSFNSIETVYVIAADCSFGSGPLFDGGTSARKLCKKVFLWYDYYNFQQQMKNLGKAIQRDNPVHKRTVPIDIMAKLYFRHGAMGSSKTANALMVVYNYYERGKQALLVKPQLDTRDLGMVSSRIGLSQECKYVEELVNMTDEQIREYDCIVVDEAQFCKKSDIEFFVRIVDELEIPVICYGLRTDFRREPFEGSLWLLAWADVIEELKTVCWCGNGACCNTRYAEDGTVVREGAQVFLGANDKYIALCRKHYKEGNLGPKLRKM